MTPKWFAEDLLRVYTKKPQFFGLVQAGYRAVLASMPKELPETLAIPGILDSMALTPPATEAPSTPKANRVSNNSSFSFPATSDPCTTPFSNNSFTTVPSSFVPGSPSRTSKKHRNASVKRSHDASQTSLSQREGGSKKRRR